MCSMKQFLFPGFTAALLMLTPAFAAQTITYTDGEVRTGELLLEEETTLYIGSGTATQTGDISGSLGFTKTGEGTLIFDPGYSSSGGPIIVEAGTLSMGNSDALPNGNLEINGGTLNLNGNGSLDSLNGTGGTLNLGSEGTIYLNSGGTFGGAINGGSSIDFLYEGTDDLVLTGAIHQEGYFYISYGKVAVSGAAYFSNITFYGGGLSITDGTTTIDNTLYLGSGYEAARLEVSGGAQLSVNGSFYSAAYEEDESFTRVTGSGSHLQSSSSFEVADSGHGAMVIANGGKITAGDGTVELALGSTGHGTLAIGGAEGEAAEAAGSVAATRINTEEGNGTLLFNHTSEEPYALEHEGAAIGITGLTRVVQASGFTLLTGESTYSGGTLITGGTLAIRTSGSGSALGTGAVEVGVDGALAGVGRISGATTVAGRLAPGQSAGAMTFESDLTLLSTAIVEMEIGGRGAGDFDLIEVNGDLTFAGELVITFIDGFIPEESETFALFNFTEASGDFSRLVFSNPGLTGSFDAATGLLTVAPIPEPGTWTLLGLSGLALFSRFRRKK